MPRVSVLLPCYNAASTLPRAIASLRVQTLSDFEVVAVDDGSDDGTLALLEGWSRQDPRVHVLARPHAGLVEALNAGLSACRAEYVARMDADDHAHAERLERQAAFLDDHPATSVVSCLVRAAPPGRVRAGFLIYINWLNALVVDDDIRREIFIESPLPHPSVMFRKQKVLSGGGYQDHGWAEDYDLWLRLYLSGARFAKVPRVLLDWHDREDRLTRTHPRYSLENFLRAKAHYLARGPLSQRDGIIVWGAGMTGRRLSKHLEREGLPLAAFVDIDPQKIGRTRRGRPIIPPEDLTGWWSRYSNPAMLAAVGARGARPLIRARLIAFGLVEGQDWWSVA